MGVYLIAAAVVLHALLWLIFARYSGAPSAPRLAPSYSYYQSGHVPARTAPEGIGPRDDPKVPRQSVEFLAKPYGWVSHERTHRAESRYRLPCRWSPSVCGRLDARGSESGGQGSERRLREERNPVNTVGCTSSRRGMSGTRRLLKVATVLLTLWTAATDAQEKRPDPLRQVGIDQRLNAQVPLELLFRDERGASRRLGDFVVAACQPFWSSLTTAVRVFVQRCSTVSLPPSKKWAWSWTRISTSSRSVSIRAKGRLSPRRRKPPTGTNMAWPGSTGDGIS